MGTTSPQSSTRLDALAENDINSLKQGIAGYGVISGLTAAAGTGLQVVIASGTVRVGTGVVTKSTSTNVAISAADATNPRKDVIYIASTGTITLLEGTPEAATPAGSTKFQLLTPSPSEVPSGGVILCEVYVAAGATSFVSTDILDRRVIIRSSIIIPANGVANVYASDGSTLLFQVTEPEGNVYIKGKYLHI